MLAAIGCRPEPCLPSCGAVTVVAPATSGPAAVPLPPLNVPANLDAQPATADAMVPAAASFPRLLADIGGTNARFGWLAAPGSPVAQVHKLPVPDFAGPAEAARHYLQGLQQLLGADYQPPRHAAICLREPACCTKSDFGRRCGRRR